MRVTVLPEEVWSPPNGDDRTAEQQLACSLVAYEDATNRLVKQIEEGADPAAYAYERSCATEALVGAVRNLVHQTYPQDNVLDVSGSFVTGHVIRCDRLAQMVKQGQAPRMILSVLDVAGFGDIARTTNDFLADDAKEGE